MPWEHARGMLAPNRATSKSVWRVAAVLSLLAYTLPTHPQPTRAPHLCTYVHTSYLRTRKSPCRTRRQTRLALFVPQQAP